MKLSTTLKNSQSGLAAGELTLAWTRLLPRSEEEPTLATYGRPRNNCYVIEKYREMTDPADLQ
jgi:hypothetical protein